MISVELARSKILAGIRPVGVETVSLAQALGRVLAADARSRVAHPPVAVSAMDGYAVRAADLASPPVTLPVVGMSAAGHPFSGRLEPGQALRIFTGAALPEGADAVIMQEDTTAEPGRVTITVATAAGKFIRPAGLDFDVGQVLMTAGTLISARAVGLAAAMNLPWLEVRRRPRVAILSTGDEVVMPGDPMGPAQIVGSNGPSLVAHLQSLGCEAVHLGIAGDDKDSLARLIASAQGMDLLVTSGGAAQGDFDLVQDVLAEAGMVLDFYKIAMRPGKPLMFGSLKGTPVLGLPGNPVSAMVCATVFLDPLVRALQGLPTDQPTILAELGRDLPANDARQEFMRGQLVRHDDGRKVATPFERQDSAQITALVRADCLVIRPPHAVAAKAGDPVEVLELAPLS